MGRIRNGRNVTAKNIYNIGNVYLIPTVWNQSKGAICGYVDYDTSIIEIKNGYYTASSCDVAVGKKEDTSYGVTKTEKMDDVNIKNAFNSYIDNPEEGIDTLEWKKWTIVNGNLIFEN